MVKEASLIDQLSSKMKLCHHNPFAGSSKIIAENTREDSSKNENLKLSIGQELNYTTVGGQTLPSFRIYDEHLLVVYL